MKLDERVAEGQGLRHHLVEGKEMPFFKGVGECRNRRSGGCTPSAG